METRAITASNLPTLICLTSDQINISHSQQVFEFSEGGVEFIQFRSKKLADQDFFQEAKRSVAICKQYGAKIIINDAVEVAKEVDADGVHLGEHDISINEARSILGEDSIIGISCYNQLQRAIDAQAAGADYVAFGAMFAAEIIARRVRKRIAGS